METRKIFRVLGSLAIIVSFSAWLPAQTFELNPYAGGILGSGSVDTGTGSFDLKDQGIYGIRGAYFLTENVEIEGNFGYINHLEFEGSDPESRGYLWEASGIYRFDLEKIKPFLSPNSRVILWVRFSLARRCPSDAVVGKKNA